MRRHIDWRTVLSRLGGVIAALSGYMVVTFAMEAAGGGDGTIEPPIYAGMIVFFTGSLVAGAYLSWRMGRPVDTLPRRPQGPTWRRSSAASAPPAEPPRVRREREILALAEKEQGRVTVLEVAARCDLTADEAKAHLDDLALRKFAQLQVSESGVLVYVFPGFLPGSSRGRRRRERQ